MDAPPDLRPDMASKRFQGTEVKLCGGHQDLQNHLGQGITNISFSLKNQAAEIQSVF